MGERGVKNPEKLPTSFMDGPFAYATSVAQVSYSYKKLCQLKIGNSFNF